MSVDYLEGLSQGMDTKIWPPEPAPSPFLPGTNIQYAWDATSLEKFKACPRLYYYEQICGWQSKGANVHLRFGVEYHEALQNYDKSRAAGHSHEDSLYDVISELLKATGDWWEEDELADMRGSAKDKTKMSLVRTIIWHTEKYKDDAMKTYIKADGKAAVEQSFRFELDWGPQTAAADGGVHYILCGHLDKIVDYADGLYVLDYKTSYMEPTSWFFERFDPHNQMTLYSFAAKVIVQAPVKGVIIDAAYNWHNKNEEGTTFGRDMTSRTDAQIEEWVNGLRFWFAQAEQCAIADHWPMNDASCERYGGCKFRKVCSKSPQVRERFLEADFIKLDKEDIWNPLKNRE